MKKIMIGVDLGGTKIMTGAIDTAGRVLGTPVKVPTESHLPKEIILKKIIDAIEKTISDLKLTIKDVAGIGIGTTGPLDIETGVILECPQLPTMPFFPLREAVQSYFGIPVSINNDANCLIFGECIFGAAVHKKNVLGFTLGTGIGCAIVMDGKILNGATGTAGEIWTSPYQEGIMEDYISGAGVSKIYKFISGNDKSSLEIYQMAECGDADALQTWAEFGTHLAVPLAWAINIIDPEIVVLGGSIAAAHPFFKDTMEVNLRKRICPVPAEKTKVVLAQLGDYAGFIGAACLLLENCKNRK
ncbi:MAG: ROK family protein [Bacteroidales bacterium]|nr:ROK family protein [Bacteroidales bacterium]MDD3907579.1 ROK family protein [Bacteroidales bacterium]MDD4712193.1 ROK family protein [Bacteroidales bacterium]